MYVFPKFTPAIGYAKDLIRIAPVVHSRYWQGVDISKMREAATAEVLHFSMKVPMDWDPLAMVEDIKPDRPWADDHFAERVSGIPYNPPPSEAWWPHAPKGQGNDKFLKSYNGSKTRTFSHSYPERMWPKTLGVEGLRFPYGDLDDVCWLLVSDPLTRQAYLPIWWPEDGGAAANERKPCTLGYQFIIRPDGKGIPRLDIVYDIRSCDFSRHFRNDIYFAVRLADWVRARARELASSTGEMDAAEFLKTVQPGKLVMHITSLHLFYNDYVAMFGKAPGY